MVKSGDVRMRGTSPEIQISEPPGPMSIPNSSKQAKDCCHTKKSTEQGPTNAASRSCDTAFRVSPGFLSLHPSDGEKVVIRPEEGISSHQRDDAVRKINTGC